MLAKADDHHDGKNDCTNCHNWSMVGFEAGRDGFYDADLVDGVCLIAFLGDLH